MKAGEIHILMHHYTRHYPYPEPSPFYHQTIKKFQERGILAHNLMTTPKGEDLVRRLMEVEI